MSEEKKLILKMLKEGKITDDEALNLLNAIGEKDDKKENKNKINDSSFEKSVNGFVNTILTGVEKALNKAGEAINNMDIDLANVNFSNIKYNGSKTIIKKTDKINDPINLFINNLNGSIQIQNSNEDYVECIAITSYDDKFYDNNSEFIVHKIEGNNHYFGIDTDKNNINFISQLIVNIPTNKTLNLRVKNSNSKILANNLELENVIFETTNGKIEARNIKAYDLEATTTNSKIELFEIKSKLLKAHTTNGKITLSKLNCVEIDAKNINGSLYINNVYDDARNMNLKSTNGGIYIEGINFEKSIKAVLKGKNNEILSPKFSKIIRQNSSITAYSDLYSENRDETLTITAETSNGKISFI